MVSLKVTKDEAENGLSDAKRDAAVAAIHEDGFVVLENAVDTAHLDALRERMLEDLERILAREDTPFNFNAGNVQQDPPPFPPYLFKDVLLNDAVISVTRAVLGPGVTNAYYSGNTALTGGQRQPVHPDSAQLWPNLETAPPAYGLVVNVPVVDMSAENGSTELWPGTHRDLRYTIYDGSLRVPEAVLEARRAGCPPFQPTVARGSIVIRDIRLWHAGMPNHTPQPRPMIAMIHWCGWYGHMDTVSFPRGTESFFEHPHLRTNARFIDEPINHVLHNQAYDFRK